VTLPYAAKALTAERSRLDDEIATLTHRAHVIQRAIDALAELGIHPTPDPTPDQFIDGPDGQPAPPADPPAPTPVDPDPRPSSTLRKALVLMCRSCPHGETTFDAGDVGSLATHTLREHGRAPMRKERQPIDPEADD